jgi:hypothetical protein
VRKDARPSDIIKVPLKNFALLMAALLLAGFGSGSAAQEPALPTPEAFLANAQALLQKGDIQGYLNLFSPDLRGREQASLSAFFNDFKMESLKLNLAGKRVASDGQVYLCIRPCSKRGSSS